MAETADYIQTLQAAIRKAYDREAGHAGSVPVREVFQGKTVWDSVVEVFDLIKHPLARRAYAWGHAMRDTGNETRVVTILGMSPVDSPRKAVQMSILSGIKSRQDHSYWRSDTWRS
jgi:hypothetical protein